MSYKEKSAGKAMRSGKVCVVMRLAYRQLLHSIAGIGSAKRRDTPRHATDVFVIGNVRR
jgi:hypothetical protein